MMRPDQTKDALAGLLQLLERVERPIEQAPIRRWSDLQPEANSQLANQKEAQQCSNRLVERIASAMLRLRAHGG
jgi:hypothetical protein